MRIISLHQICDGAFLITKSNKPTNADELLALYNYSAMQACIRTDSPEQAKLLLDRGMDFDQYTEWAEKDRHTVKSGETFEMVKEYWETGIKQADSEEMANGQNNEQTMGGM